MLLVSLDRVREYLGEKTAGLDALLERLTAVASARVEQYCSRNFLQQTSTEVFNGAGTKLLPPPRWPITDVAAVRINGVDVPKIAQPSSAPVGFTFDDRFVMLAGGYEFHRGMQNVSITYTAGYPLASIPDDLAQAVVDMVALYMQERTRVGHESKTLAQETVQYTTKEMPDQIKQKLAPYQNKLLWS